MGHPVDVISSYINLCMDTEIPSKKIIIFPNNKLWVAKDLKSILNKKKRTFFVGHLNKEVNKKVKRAVRQA